MLLPLYIGAVSVVLETLRPIRKVLKTVLKNRVTVFIAIPQIYRVLTDVKLPLILRLPFVKKILLAIRFAISGAAPLTLDVIKNFEQKFNIPLLEGYGLTEASPVVSLNPLNKRKPGSIGITLPGVEAKIIDEKGTKAIC